MVKVYDSLVPPFEYRPFAVSVSMCCYERFNVLLSAIRPCSPFDIAKVLHWRGTLSDFVRLLHEKRYFLVKRLTILQGKEEVLVKWRFG